MKNHKQLLADFYLALLGIPLEDRFRILNQNLYGAVRNAIAQELGEDDEIVQRIFERMAAEDTKF